MGEFDEIERENTPNMHAPHSNSCLHTGKPRAGDYLPQLGSLELSLSIACCVITIVTVLIYLEEIVHLHTQLTHWKPKRKALVLLAIYPMTSVNAMLAMLMPRVAGLTDLTVSLYYAFCMFLFSQMVLQHYGGKGNMVRRLRDQTIPLQSPPVCCVLFCLPRPSINITRINVIEFLVIQYVVLKPIGTYILALMVTDAGGDFVLWDKNSSAMLYQATTIMNTCATFVAVYGNVLLFRMSRESLNKVNIRAKFYLMQSVVVIENLQRLLMAVLVSFGVMGCIPPLDVNATSTRMHHQLLILEMLILSLLARIYYRHDVRSVPLEDIRRDITSHSVSVATSDSMGAAPPETAQTYYEPQPMANPCAASVGSTIAVDLSASINAEYTDDTYPII